VKVQRIGGWGGAIHVFPDEPFAKALAGPFGSESAAQGWVVERIEHGLSPTKLEIWRTVAARLSGPTDYGLELALIGLVAHGLSLERLAKYLPTHRVRDHRMAAAGDGP